MKKTGATARWSLSTGASLVLMVAVAVVAAPVVSAGPGDGGGNDPIAGLFGDGGPGFFGGGGDGGGEGEGGGQAVHGRAMSRGEADSYGLALRARGDGDQVRGRLFFGHRSDGGGEGFAGDITCLSVGEDGVVQVSGTTREGRGHHGGHRRGGDEQPAEPAPGEEQAGGQDFAFTILTMSDPQQFSLPKMGEAGTLAPCGGGDATTVAVTRGGFDAHR